jgi:hypothetical protein
MGDKKNYLIYIIIGLFVLTTLTFGTLIFFSTRNSGVDSAGEFFSTIDPTNISFVQSMMEKVGITENKDVNDQNATSDEDSNTNEAQDNVADVDLASFDAEWSVYEKSEKYIANKDMEGLNSMTYDEYSMEEILSEFQTSNAEVKEEDVWELLQGPWTGPDSEEPQKNEFSILQKDEQQTIIATEITQEGEFYDRYFMYFVRNEGKYLLVSHRSSTLSGNWFTDSDKDGATDRVERCEGANEFNEDCVVTDPNKKDSDGDGWWDGVEEQAETDPTNGDSVLTFN